MDLQCKTEGLHAIRQEVPTVRWAGIPGAEQAWGCYLADFGLLSEGSGFPLLRCILAILRSHSFSSSAPEAPERVCVDLQGALRPASCSVKPEILWLESTCYSRCPQRHQPSMWVRGFSMAIHCPLLHNAIVTRGQCPTQSAAFILQPEIDVQSGTHKSLLEWCCHL